MYENLYSIRMRAARGGPHERGGRHISGAERIVSEAEIPNIMNKLFFRAQQHELGRPDFININIELLPAKDIQTVTSLPVHTIRSGDHREGRELAKKILQLTGIQHHVIEQGFNFLLEDPSSNEAGIRGAILMDVNTGHRLEPDPYRGIRASRMDYDPEAEKILSQKLEKFGLNNNHVREALCLATKVAHMPGIAAELCWSDDPGYTAGYVASSNLGYIRFNHLKEKGSRRGGRVFFFDPTLGTREEVIKKLEQEPYVITKLGPIYGELTFDEFKKLIEGMPGK